MKMDENPKNHSEICGIVVCACVCVCVKFSRIEKNNATPHEYLMMSHSGSQLCQSWFAFKSQGPLLQWIPVTMPQLQVLLPSLNAQLSQGLQPSHGKFAELPHTCATVTKMWLHLQNHPMVHFAHPPKLLRLTDFLFSMRLSPWVGVTGLRRKRTEPCPVNS